MKKIVLSPITYVYLFLAIMLGIFTIFDLNISVFFYSPNFYGQFFEVLGEQSGYLLCVFASTILFINSLEKHQRRKYLYFFLFIICCGVSSYLPFHYLHKVNHEPILYFHVVVTFLFLSSLSIIVVKKIRCETRFRLQQFAQLTIFLFLFQIILVTITKTIWGRERFREMVDPIVSFTPWYSIQFRGTFKEAFASFPSGHTANASVILMISTLPCYLNSLKNKKKYFIILPICWIFLVAFSRIVMGAHFASDVIMGFAITLSCFLFINRNILK